jgi:hypothetical protein
MQLEFDYSVSPDFISATSEVVEAGASAPLKLPNFSVSNQVYAVTARIAGRLNAATVSEEEHKSLLDERQALLDKKLDGTITRWEENRLEYVRWSLDRIEDAKYGYVLDELENRIHAYEQFLSEIDNLRAQLEQHTRTSKHQKQRKRR